MSAEGSYRMGQNQVIDHASTEPHSCECGRPGLWDEAEAYCQASTEPHSCECGRAAVVSGFDVLRAATADKGVEGIRHYSHLHGLLPRLGPYVDKPRSSPFDFDAAVRLTAGRPVLLIAPTLDRYVRAADVAAAVKPLARPGLTVETPLDFNRFRRQTQQRVVRWLTEVRDRNGR